MMATLAMLNIFLAVIETKILIEILTMTTTDRRDAALKPGSVWDHPAQKVKNVTQKKAPACYELAS